MYPDTVYTFAPKYPYWDYFKAKTFISYLGTWTLRVVCGLRPPGKDPFVV